jgi:hypothetical protein
MADLRRTCSFSALSPEFGTLRLARRRQEGELANGRHPWRTMAAYSVPGATYKVIEIGGLESRPLPTPLLTLSFALPTAAMPCGFNRSMQHTTA